MPKKKKRRNQKKQQREKKQQKLSEYELGNQAFLSKDFPGAVGHYKKSIAEDKQNHKVWSNLAFAHLQLSEHEEALVAAEQVIAIAPRFTKGHLRKGQALAGLYRYSEAKLAYAAGLQIDAKDNALQSGLASVEEALLDLKVAESEAFQKDNPDAKKMDVLLKWLTDGGSIFPKLYMRWYSYDFRGVHALTNVRNGELIMKIPLTHIMTCEEAKKCDTGRAIVQSGYECSSEDSYLAAYVLQEKHDQESFWKPYIDCLPQKYENMPIYFGEELLSELKGSFSLEMRAARIESLREEYDNICRHVPSFSRFTHDEFVWARLVVITRQFGITVQGVETDGLVPYADMLNHKLPRETEWTYQRDQKAFTITALQALPRGGQIYDSYGRKCNSRFFVNYGFSIDENPDNEAVIRLHLSRNDPSFSLKCRLLGGHQYSIRRRCQIPANYAHKKTQDMFSFLRFLHSQDADLLSISQMDTSKGLRIPPLNVTNESKVLAELKEKALYSLSLFKTTIAEDEKLLDTVPMYSNIRNCYVMRWGEKKVLQFFVDLADTGLPLLAMSWRQLKPVAAKVRHATKGIDLYVSKVVVPLVKKASRS